MSEPASTIRPDAGPSGEAATPTHFLALARHLGLEPDQLALGRYDLAMLDRMAGPALLFLRDGRALGVETRGGARRLVGAGGVTAPFSPGSEELAETYVGVALAPRTAAEPPRILGAGADEAPTLDLAGASAPASAPASAALDGAPRPGRLVRAIFGRILGARLPLVLQLGLVALISNLFGFALPLFTMAVYDRVIPHQATQTLIALALGVTIVLLLDLLLRLGKARLTEAIALKTSFEFQEALYARLTRVVAAAAPRSTGAVSSAFQSVEMLCATAPVILVGFLIDLPFAALTLLYVGYIGGWVVVVPLVALAVLAAVTLATHLAAKRATQRLARLTADRIAFLDQTVSMLETIKTSAAGPMLLRIWRRLLDGAGGQGFVQRMAAAQSGQATVILSQATTVGCLVVGAGLVQMGEMTMGALVAVSLLVGRAVTPVAAALASVVRLLQAADGAAAAAGLMAAPVESAGDPSRRAGDVSRRVGEGGRAAAALKGAIELQNVTFRYPDAPDPALAKVSLAIRPGERVALVGRIGCGKSSLARLITRLYAPQEGAVLLDGHDIRQYDPLALRAAIGFLGQDAELFDDTIHENLMLGLEDIEPRAFEAAVAAAGVEAFAARVADGYSFRIGPRGRRLSGGERQMVALARALMAPTPILLLDEPTAALDSQHEAQVVARLKPLVEGRTLILCTHRAPTLALVDRVVWLERGRVLADGPRDEIVARIARGG